MAKSKSIKDFINENRDICVEALRIYLGFILLVKSFEFLFNPKQAGEYLEMVNLPFFGFLGIHVVALVHLAGGLLLAIGLITRIAALIQVPILLGAIFFVHLQQGLFTKEQTLEYVILILFLLVFFVIYGGGRISVDGVLEERSKRH